MLAPELAIEIFTEALQLPFAERSAFLDRSCGDDEELRRKIEALLKSHQRADGFLEQPATEEIGAVRAGAAVGERPGSQVDRYKVLQQIGEGGCGVVFIAEQEHPIRRRVALKVIKPGMDTKSVIARFEAERQVLALMDHPNIAHVFDAGATESGRPYFVMELVEGMKISDYCDRHLLSLKARLALFIQVCDAIQHAHQKGIIHRDIKPSNILVTTGPDGAPVPKVIDFGIAKATGGQLLTDKTLFTAREMLIGTPAYMSPEQALLGTVEVDTRTDIYSLGVLLYELLTGITPFDTRELLKAGFDEVRRVIREKDPVRPSTQLSKLVQANALSVSPAIRAEVPMLVREMRGDLDWIVMQALEKDRTRRYATANGLAVDIRRYLAHEPVSARPPSSLYRLRKGILRNRLLFASVLTIASLLIAGLVVDSVALSREKRARAKSQQVTQFLEEMLSGVGPSVALGEDTKMLRRILDQTTERVGKELNNQPEVEAELCGLIANLYQEIGKAGKGEEMARRALLIRRQKSGPDGLETAAALNLLGEILMVQHKLPEAERTHAQALAIRSRRLGPQNADTATSLNDLAAVYREQRRLQEAEPMARNALRIRETLFGSQHLDVADSLRNLCLIQGYGERWAEAEQTGRRVLAMRRSLLGDQDPRIASALGDLAWALGAQGKFEEAQSLETEALSIQQNLLGDAHPDVPFTLNSIGKIFANRGDLATADGVLKAVLSIQRKILGDDTPATLETFASLAKVLLAQGKREEAEAVWREALAIWDTRGEPDETDRLYAVRGLAETLEAGEKWPEAESLWRESLTLWRKREPTGERQPMYTLRRLGLALEAQQKWSDAALIHQEALSISRQKGDHDSEALVDLERLVRALLAQKQFSEAEHLLLAVLTPEFSRQPGAAKLLIERVNLLGRTRHWREAAVQAGLLLELQPADHYRYHTLVTLLAITNDRPAYDQLCRRFASTFPNTTDCYVAERIAQDCLLLPDAGADTAAAPKTPSMWSFRRCPATAFLGNRLGPAGTPNVLHALGTF